MTTAAPEPSAAGDGRGILAAVRLTSLVSILGIACGVLTNKIVAVVAGTEGVGLLGLYRTVSGILSAVLPLGANDIVVQRLSTAPDPATARRVVGASLTFLAAQSLLVLLLAIFAARAVAGWIFPTGQAERHLWDVRLLLGLGIGVLALQAVTAALNGFARLRDVSRVNLATSVLTLATVYPFLRLGSVGLSFVIGATCFAGAALGWRFLAESVGGPLRRLEPPRSWAAFRAALPLSPWLALQPMLNTGSALVVQIVLTRRYGLTVLGHYNAAALLETTAIMVLMSSMRSYYLPTLGRFTDFAHKRSFANKVLLVLLVLLLAGTTVMVVGAPLIVRLLFSASFAPAENLVRVLAVSMVGQVLVWCSAMFLLHSADYRTFVLLDAVWATVRVGGTVACAVLDAPVEGLAWVHAGSYVVSAVCYSAVIRARYRGFLIDGMNALLALTVLGLLVAARLLLAGGPVGAQVVFCGIVAVLCAVAGNHGWRRLRA